VVPGALGRMLSDPDSAKAGRAMQAMLTMEKLDLTSLQRAYDGAVSGLWSLVFGLW
jgi:hypothetical protein